MNDAPHPHRRPSVTDRRPVTGRPVASLATGILLVASVPAALWAVANPIAAAILVAFGILLFALATRPLPLSGRQRAADARRAPEAD